jgi:hypothetical protein
MRGLPKVQDEAPQGLRRITLVSDGYVVGFGLVFADGFTRLDVLTTWAHEPKTYVAGSLSEALKQGWGSFPSLDWEWTCG